jgi:hypothetical protein
MTTDRLNQAEMDSGRKMAEERKRPNKNAVNAMAKNDRAKHVKFHLEEKRRHEELAKRHAEIASDYDTQATIGNL